MSEFSELVIFSELNEYTRSYARAKAAGDPEETSKAYQGMLLKFMAIKKMNTSLAERLQKSRELREDAKNTLDRLKLKAANREYKREHLLRDIQGCKALLTPLLNKVEVDMDTKLAVTEYSENLEDLHSEALGAMDKEIKSRDLQMEKYERLNNTYEASYTRYDKKRKFLEQDAPSHLEKIKELMDAMNSDFNSYIERHAREQKMADDMVDDDDDGGDMEEDEDDEDEDEDEDEDNEGEESDDEDGGGDVPDDAE